jgi:hypothetical protein
MTPTATVEQAYIEEFDYREPGRFVIRCYHCRASNGSISVAYADYEVIGESVHLDGNLVNKGKPKDGLPRYGLPDRVLKGKGPRESKVEGQMRRFLTAVHPPLWFHCVECNRGQRLDAVLTDSIG